MQFNLKNRTVKNAGFCAIYSAWGPWAVKGAE
jgi:hypothetical protein